MWPGNKYLQIIKLWGCLYQNKSLIYVKPYDYGLFW